MNIEEFRTKVAECIKERTDNLYTLINNDAVKNNGVILHGLVFKREGRNVSPTLYLEAYTDEYDNGKTIDEIAGMLIRDEENSWNGIDVDAECFTDYNWVRNKMFIKLINTSLNEELLKHVPSRQFLDLSIVVYCSVDGICDKEGTILIRREHIKRWNVSDDELIDEAIDNTRKKGVRTEDMFDFASSLLDDREEKDIPCMGHEKGDMLVLSNQKLIFGAACMIFEDILNKMCNENNTSYYIIPSSIHEVLLISERLVTGDACDLNLMIRQVNAESVRSEDILAEHAYFYSILTGYEAV